MSSSWGVSLLLLIQLKKSVTRGRLHINVDSNLPLLVPYPVQAFRFIFESVTLGSLMIIPVVLSTTMYLPLFNSAIQFFLFSSIKWEKRKLG